MSLINIDQGYVIATMLQAEFSRKELCESIGKNKSVLSREIARNADKLRGRYEAGLAQRKCIERYVEKPKRQTFTTV